MAIHRRIRVPGDPGDRITVIGIAWNIVLLVMKVVLGILTGSAGLVADGIHSASDIATDLAVLGGMHIGRREADEEHPYGHGRFETLAGGTVAGVLMLVGGFIAWEGIVALYRGEHSFPGGVVVAAAVASILVKEWMYRRTARVAKALDSAALQANAWHHRSDALSSVAVLAGGIGGLVGWGYADHVAGLVVGLMVVGAGAKTLAGVLHELTEGGLSGDDVDLLRRTISTVGGVRGSHRLRTRRVGRETFVDVHVLVDPSLSIVEAHQVSSDVETAIHRAWSRPVNVTVHVEPEEGRFSDA